MQFKGQYWRVVLIFAAVVSILGFSTPAKAQPSTQDAQKTSDSSQECSPQINNDNSGLLAPLPQDTYSVYLQLAKRGQYAEIKLSAVESDKGLCTTIGSVKATGDGWTKVGSWNMTNKPDAGGTFLLESEELDFAVDANRPTVMLVSESNPTCTPNPTCQVAVEGQLGTILPLSNSIASNGLLVTRVVPPENDTITRVVYYVNERQVYTTKTPKPFDLRYVTHAQERTVSVIEYASGQRISIIQPIPASHSDTFFNFLFRLYQTNPSLILTISISTAVWLAGALLFSIVKARERRYHWRLVHGLIKETPSTKKVSTNLIIENFHKLRIKTFATKSFAITSILLFVIVTSVAFNRYIATFYSVSGASMANAYQNGNEVFVNRVPVTLSQFANRAYIPKRGEVVILHANYGPNQPNQPDAAQKDFIIKRVIGLPGERVTVINGVITVYTTDGGLIQPDADNSWRATMIADERIENIDLTLGGNELFVSGDNRPESLDSRFNGAIEADQLAGVVAGKLW